ncbi:MAG TPA: tetratricopeptide repeat protein [Kofleriaceae bacterium]|nr:tetratricopeptide repeat protein [Kofleriaceae bacterium]
MIDPRLSVVSLARLARLALLVLCAATALRAAPAAAQPAQPDDRSKAASHFKLGQTYYKSGDYERAIAEYKAAFELSKEPSLIFNIALCHDRAQRPEEALKEYRHYLDLAPSGDVADEARDEVARLTPIVDKRAADRSTAQAAEEAARRERERREAMSRPAPPASRVPLYIMGAGALVVAAGGVAHVLAVRTRGQLETEQDPEAYFNGRDTFELQRNVAIGAYAVGAATVLTGLVLKLTVFRQRGAPEVSAAVTPHGALVTVGWSR